VAGSGLAERYGIEAFDLFCAYHLGITEDGGYRFQNVHQVARRFGANAGVIRQLLEIVPLHTNQLVFPVILKQLAKRDACLFCTLCETITFLPRLLIGRYF